MNSVEFTYWLAYDRIDPYGEERADWRAGQVAAITGNCHRSKNADPFKAADFMFKYQPADKPVEQTPEQLAKRLDSYFTGLMIRAGTTKAA